jgi:site-specific recombinase XerD
LPRKARDERLDTRTARLKLKPRAEPYWRSIQEGRAVGYRRLAGGKAGNWIARHYSPSEGRRYQALGTADDLMDADGHSTLTFAQAQAKAHEWFNRIERHAGRAVQRLTVAEAVENYMADYLARGGKSERDTRRAINAHILPRLGPQHLDALTHAKIRAWHHALAEAPARLRTSVNATKANVREADGADARRARRSTANRVLTILKAALTHAYREGHVASDDAWRRVRPFQRVEAPRVRYLSDDEARRLVNACPEDLRRLASAALHTGGRYGELAALRVGDFDADGRVLHLRDPKVKRRAVYLGAPACDFFTLLTAGRPASALMLTREDGRGWGKSHQFRPLREASAAARISPAVSSHVLRHTFASRLAMRGVPMSVIAEAIGDTEATCAKHYAHLAPGYVADTIRQHGLDLDGGRDDTTVVPMRRA